MVNGKPIEMLSTQVSSMKQDRLDPGTKVPTLCIHGDIISLLTYLIAEVELMSGAWRKITRVAVAPNLTVTVLLGRDVVRT